MISIVCPFYNERENLEELCSRLAEAVRRLPAPCELVFVDDGSTDGGGEFLNGLLAKEKVSGSVVTLPQNSGLTAALYAGLMRAKGEILVTLDADLQNPPEEIPRLVELLEGYDVVAGVRANRRDSFVKRASSKIANAVRRAVLGDSIQDIACSLRAFRRSVLPCFYPQSGMHRFFLAVAAAEGFRITQVPVAHAPRLRGKAKYGLFNRLLGPLRDLITVRRLLRRKVRCCAKETHHAA